MLRFKQYELYSWSTHSLVDTKLLNLLFVCLLQDPLAGGGIDTGWNQERVAPGNSQHWQLQTWSLHFTGTYLNINICFINLQLAQETCLHYKHYKLWFYTYKEFHKEICPFDFLFIFQSLTKGFDCVWHFLLRLLKGATVLPWSWQWLALSKIVCW